MIEDYEVTIEDGTMHAYPGLEYNNPQGLGNYIFQRCEKYYNNVFQICPYANKSMTFGEFKVKSVNLAINLRKLCSIQEGDIVMTCMKNSLENSLPVAATFFLNAVTCSLDPTLSVRDCEHLIGLVEPKVIIVDADVVENIKTALKKIGKESIIIANNDSDTNQHGNLHLQHLVQSNEDTQQFRPVIVEDGNTMGVILFSSGTTGLPKGICISQKSLYNISNIMHIYMSNPKVMALCTTFYWLSGLGLFLSQYIIGTTRVALRKFDVDQFCNVCKEYKIESVFIAACHLSKMLEEKDKITNLSSFRHLFTGGMMSSKSIFDKLKNTFPNIHVSQAYAMSETAGAGCGFVGKYKKLSYQFPESVGLPLPGVDIKIVDKESGQILGQNETGIIHLRSNWCMLGYYKNKTENPFQEDGFLNTGDMGYYDENKLIYISGRSKDMFKYQSWHIVPASLEAVIKEHPDVDEAAVFGIPHGGDGHLPSAAITLKKNCSTNIQPEDIANFVAERVADRQRLRGGVYILAEMPKTPTGKIQSSKLCDMLTNPATGLL